MPSIPIAVFLIPYVIILAVFGLFYLVNVYHLVHYGASTTASRWASVAFLGATACILLFTYTALQGTDWTTPISLGLPSFELTSPDLLFP
jgi:hypothetical protein